MGKAYTEGAENEFPAAIAISLNVNKAAQSAFLIRGGDLIADLSEAGQVTLTAQEGTTSGAIVWSSGNEKVLTIDSGGNLIFAGMDTARVTAQMAGNDDYEAGSAKRSRWLTKPS